MGTTLPDESSAETDSPQNTPETFEITFLFGPPIRGVDAVAFAEAAPDRRLTREEFWIQVVKRNVDQLLESNAEGRSVLDDMFSDALGQLVTLWEVEFTVRPYGDGNFPGLITQPQKVLDALGRPTERNLADREVLSRIANAVMGFTRAGSTICILTSDTSEFMFPILREGVKGGALNA